MNGHESPRAVAIVGIGCRFPGGANDAAAFWRLLMNGVDAITPIPADRFDVGHFFDPAPATPGRIMSRLGGYLDGLREFDAEFFGISPREAERIDPQQRLLLETAWEALEDAGQDVRALEGTTTGVYVGQWVSDFEGRLFSDPESVDFYMTMGTGRYATSGRISYALGLRGPSLTLDTACSSSLAAVHLGVRSIREGESSLVLAGGVNLILQPHITIAYSQPRMMAADGHCKFGDASGDGYVRSEGAGLVVLKPLDRALADGDRIYAVIRGSAINNDGRSSGTLGRPSRLGQEELLRAAYRDAGIPPGEVGYVEAHGTGTRAGDPVELGALNTVLADGRPAGRPLLVGSVKTNIGHTEAAAGVAGLIKAALALHHGRIPASLHYREPNPRIEWDVLPLEVAREAHDWPHDARRVAGVTSFGIGGSNAHVVLEAAPVSPVREPSSVAPLILPLSARSAPALGARVAAMAAWLRRSGNDAANASHSAARLTALEHRAVFVGPDPSHPLEQLDGFAADGSGTLTGVVDPASRPRVAFVVPGQGGQWTGMARDLMRTDESFRETIMACDAAIAEVASWSLVEQLQLDEDAPAWRLGRIDVIQPALVALALAYAASWRARGVVPDAIVGHSMGEVGAACLAGVIDVRTAMHLICRRSTLMYRTSGRGAMAVLELTVNEARARLRGLEDRVTVAVSNSPRSTVISGDPDAVREVVAAAERDGVFARLVKVDVASHSPQMETLAAELASDFAGLEPRAGEVALYSSVLGRPVDGRDLGGNYWGRNLREPVRFADTISAMVQDGIGAFIELGPHPVLKPAIEQTGQASGQPLTVIACGSRDEDSQLGLFEAFGAAWVAGLDVSLRVPGVGRHVSLPAYPWQREYHWVDAAEVSPVGPARSRTPLDDAQRSWLYRTEWIEVPVETGSGTGQRWLIVGAERDATALAACARKAGVATETATIDGLDRALVASADRAVNAVVILAEEGAAPDLPVHIARTVLSRRLPRHPRLWFVTRGAQQVEEQDGSELSVAHAALWGAGLVVGEEHPEMWGGLLDLLPGTNPVEERDLSTLVAAMLQGGEDQLGLRSGRVRARRLVPVARSPEAGSPPIEGPWLITGGLGDVGLQLARALAGAGARRLILAGRTPLPPRTEWNAGSADERVVRRIQAVRELEAAGVAVHLGTVDVSDAAALDTFLRRYAADAWPPIRGVVHAAGTLQNRLVESMDAETFQHVMASKLDAALALDRLLPDAEAFVMVSSTGAFLPQPGQANYAAANAGLDAVAVRRNARGRRALSIQWAVCEDTGLVRGESGARGVADMRRNGIEPFTPLQGQQVFTALLAQATGVVAVVPADWATWRDSRPGRSSTIAAELLAGVEPAGHDGAVVAPSGQRQVERVVREAVGQVLKVPPSRIDPRKALGVMGLSSILAMELRNRLERALGRPLSATIAWNYPTIDALVQYLSEGEPEGPERVVMPVASAAGDIGEAAALDDADVLRALRQRGTGASS